MTYLHKWVSQKPQPNRLSMPACCSCEGEKQTIYNSPFDSTFGVMGTGQAWASLTHVSWMANDCYYYMVGLINCSLNLQAVTHTPCKKEMVSRMQSYVYSVSGSQQNLWHWDFVASIWYSNIRPQIYYTIKIASLTLCTVKNVMVIYFSHCSFQL